MNTNYRIVEIFESLQGEGYNTGMPAIFLRFGKCNLSCKWCDTEYNNFTIWTLEEILGELSRYQTRNIIITGGEPTIQPHLSKLLSILTKQGYFLAIESNGLKPIPVEIDYIALSPKRAYIDIYRNKPYQIAHEVRLIVDSEIRPFCELIEDKIKANNYYLSPCEQSGVTNIRETVEQLGQLNARHDISKPHWRLSIQIHKLIGIR